jgi:hypothetical protein
MMRQPIRLMVAILVSGIFFFSIGDGSRSREIQVIIVRFCCKILLDKNWPTL